MVRNVLAIVLVAGILIAVVPPAVGHHCESRLVVYSRVSYAPTPAPPYAEYDRNLCFVLQSRGLEDHRLVPNADQVLVRVNGAFGSGLTELRVDLNGMGFENASLTMFRKVDPGGANFVITEWISLPDPAGASLRATVYYPGEAYSVTYYPSAVQFPLPPRPPPPSV